MTDLLALTEELCAIPSVSGDEARARRRSSKRGCASARAELDDRPASATTSIARTELGAGPRVVLGGHLDTVPANGNATPRRDGDVLHGLGAADMKGGLAVLLHAGRGARGRRRPRVDVTLVFYEGEEVADEYNGLRHLFAEQPDLRRRRPRGAARADRRLGRGRLPGHDPRAGDVPRRAGPHGPPVDGHERDPPGRAGAGPPARRTTPTSVDVDGLEYRESLQVVRIEGGDRQQRRARRCARRRQPPVRAVLLDRRARSPRSRRCSTTPTRSRCSARHRPRRRTSRTRSWPSSSAAATCSACARSSAGPTSPASRRTAIPALNFGPGDPELAHTAGEFVDRESTRRCYACARTVPRRRVRRASEAAQQR